MEMSARTPVPTESLLQPIRSPVIWGAGALPQKKPWSTAARIDKIDYSRASGKMTLSASKLRAVSAPVDTDAREPQLATDPVRAVLFDMDGVLCNSEEMTQRVGAESLLKVYGVKVDPDEFRAFAGMGEAYFLSGVAGKYGIRIDDIDKLKEVFYGIYLEKAADPTEDIGLPGAIELVKACREAGLKVAVASSADRVKVDANLKLVGFNAEADFDAIVSADLFERLKPAPDIFMAAAREVGVEPNACVVVEDAAAGVQAARAAGMRVVGVTTTLPREEMLAQEPDEVRPAIADINVNLLQGLQWARRAEVGAEDRTNSGRGAGPSDNVRA